MASKQQTKTSKYLSLILRHKPDTIGISLDENGWADVNELLEKIQSDDFQLSLEELEIVVSNSDKKRFAFSEDLTKIRSNQGHSIQVDLQLTAKTPPEKLFHGTALRNLDSIKEKGLIKGQRHHVHLSLNEDTARTVGQRYGRPVVLTVLSGQMHAQGIVFYESENGVWLTDYVAPSFIEFPL